VTIEVFSWDRSKRERDETTGEETEQTAEATGASKASLDVVNDVTRKEVWQKTQHGDVTVPVAEAAGATVGGGINVSSLNELNAVAKRTEQAIDEATAKASARIKSNHQTKILETSEVGSETRVTRKLRNQNMVRTLTYDYYEVLATHDVGTQLDWRKIRVCALIDNLLPGSIDRHFVLAHEGVLRRVLLDRVYENGLLAARRLDAFDRHCEVACAGACACSTAAPEDSGAVAAAIGTALAHLAWSIKAVASADLGDFQRAVDAALSGSVVGSQGRMSRAGVTALRRYLYRRLALERANPLWWRELREWAYQPLSAGAKLSILQIVLSMPRRRLPPGSLPNAMLSEYADEIGALGDELGDPYRQLLLQYAGFDDAWLETTFAMARAALADALAPKPHDGSATGQGATGSQDGPASGTTSTGSSAEGDDLFATGLKFADTAWMIVNPLTWAVNHGLYEIVNAGAKALAPQTQQPQLPAQAPAAVPVPAKLAADAAKAVEPETVRGYDARLIAMLQVEEAQLITHLQLNGAHYRRAIWEALDQADRYELLRTLGEHFFDVFENEVLGFVGSRAVMPYRLDANERLASWFARSIGKFAGSKPAPLPNLVTLPTGAINIQTRLGRCDTGEPFVMSHRELDVELRRTEVAQAQAEVERAKARLAQKPPLLDDPTPNDGSTPIRVRLDKPEYGCGDSEQQGLERSPARGLQPPVPEGQVPRHSTRHGHRRPTGRPPSRGHRRRAHSVGGQRNTRGGTGRLPGSASDVRAHGQSGRLATQPGVRVGPRRHPQHD
jgi:hypothetical protein